MANRDTAVFLFLERVGVGVNSLGAVKGVGAHLSADTVALLGQGHRRAVAALGQVMGRGDDALAAAADLAEQLIAFAEREAAPKAVAEAVDRWAALLLAAVVGV